MPFMVIYRNADGTPGYEQAGAIDEAAHVVEQLRNNAMIENIRLFRMEEITFNFRPYYKVELGMPERMTAAAPVSERSSAAVGAQPGRTNGSRGLFAR